MEQTSQSRCTQEQPNNAELNLTPGDNNTTEQSNKYSVDMLVDTTDHTIMKGDVKNTCVQAQAILATTVKDKREKDIIVREEREPHKHRHEDRTDWAEILFSLTDDEIRDLSQIKCTDFSMYELAHVAPHGCISERW